MLKGNTMFAREPLLTDTKEFARFPEGVVKIDYSSGCADKKEDWAYVWNPCDCNGVGVVVLHGHGSCGDQLYSWRQTESWCKAIRSARCGLLTPNLRGNAWMSPEAVEDLADLICFCKNKFNWHKILICSASMGGSGGLIFASLHPELVDGIAVMGAATDLESYVEWCDKQTLEVCGRIAAAIRTSYGSQEKMIQHSVCRNAAKLTMPCLFYHGADDKIIPVSQSRRLAGVMADSPDFFYREIYQGDHDSPCAFMPEVLSLLLENIC